MAAGFHKLRRGLLRSVAAGVVVTAITGAPSQAFGATYVDRNSLGGSCSDARSAAEASSPGSPWCSLERAVAAAPGGSVVLVRAGDYPQLVVTGGARGDYLTLRAQDGETVTLAGARTGNTGYVRLQGFRVTHSIVTDPGSHHIQIVGNRIDTLDAMGLHEGSRDILIERNHITATQGSGIHFSAAPGEPEITNVTIRANHFDNIGGTGVNARVFRNVLIEGNEFEGVHSWNGVVHPNVIRTMGTGTGLTVRGNLIHHNKAISFFIKDGAIYDVDFVNNVVVQNEGYGFQVYDVHGLRMINNTIADNLWGVLFRGNATAVVIKNNILPSLNIASGAPTTFSYEDHNYIAQASNPGPRGAHDLTTGLRFTNTPALDYRLAPGSAGIDAGTSDATPTHDRLGHPRIDIADITNIGDGAYTFYDMGAHEYGSEAVAPDGTATGGTTETPPPPTTDTGTTSPKPPRRGRKTRTARTSSVEIGRASSSSVQRGLTMTVTCPDRCRLTALVTVRVRGKRSARARLVRTLQGRRGPALVRLKFSRRDARVFRATLRGLRHARATLRVSATDRAGGRHVARRTLLLRR